MVYSQYFITPHICQNNKCGYFGKHEGTWVMVTLISLHVCVYTLKTALHLVLMVFSAWPKPVDYFVLVCAPVQRSGHEMLQTQAIAEPGRPSPQLFVRLITSFPLLPCLYQLENLELPLQKGKKELASTMTLEGCLLPFCWHKSWRFSRILRNKLGKISYWEIYQ